MRKTEDHHDEGRVAEEAARWFASLQGEAATGDDWLAFERWILASPAHARAYEQLERLWVDLDQAEIARELGGRPLVAAARRVRGQADASRRASGRSDPTRRRLWIGAGGAIAAALVVAVGVGLKPSGAPGQVYATAPGQTRTVTLADGTRIQLNSASRITVRFDRDARRVEMADAEAVFDVTHDARRPFLISAGDRQVRVVGTQFNLRRRDGLMDLTVSRGTVEVRPADRLDAQPTKVTVGQELTHAEGQPAQVLKVADPDVAFAWTNGQLIYRDQPLSAVAADLTRRFGTPVRAADARTAALRFSGVLVVDNQADVLRRLSAYAPVRVERTATEIILHHR
ncbi:FecR family protein [Phenylobacterium sp.]|jgi:transmembrane sensor|uniref:FecR family protein n=1 Tax=Phenylobacterium sp. TaxID=1871053 RepID=UPI002F3E44E4